jgi:biotin synthase-related radical SAM superfamily protein
MQKAHASACLHLGVYQSLAMTLTLTPDKSDFARLRWAEQKIEETMKRLKDNNTTTQDLLTAEIAGLKSMRQVLEESRLKL